MKKILQKIGVFAFAFAMAVSLAVPSNASAQTVSELQALIAQLQAQLNALTGGTTSVPSFMYTRDLTLGSTGADVTALQTYLEAKGFLTIPAGVSKGYFGPLTKAALARYQASVAIAPAVGYFGPITRAKVNVDSANGTSPTTGTPTTGTTTVLKGGAGNIQNISETTSGTETTLREGKTEKVLGFDIEADDNSDLAITSIKVEITLGADGSTRLTRYLDEVSIMMDGDEVGTVDASDFSRDRSVSTATIALKKAIIKMGDESRFYVKLTAIDSINDADLDNTLEVEVTRVRFEDASGAILTESASNISTAVDFEDASANDDARVKSDSSSRKAGLLKIDANKTSDEFDILSFKIDVDSDSSDLVIIESKVELIITNASSTQTLDVNKLIQDMYLEVDGQKYDDFSFDDTSIAAGATETITATFSIDEGDLEVTEGDVVEGVVFVKFGKQAGNYAEGSTIKAVVKGSGITAENPEGDTFEVSGTVNGETQTLQISAAKVDNFSWSVNNTGTIIDFYFTVEAIDEDFTFASSSLADTISGTASTSAGVLSLSTGDADTVSAGDTYTVLDGDTATFRVRYAVSGTNGTYSEVKVTSVAGQELPTNKQISPTATVNVN